MYSPKVWPKVEIILIKGIEEKYYEAKYPKSKFNKINLDKLDFKPKKGKRSGLTVVLDLQSHLLGESTSNHDYLGFQASVSQINEVSRYTKIQV